MLLASKQDRYLFYLQHKTGLLDSDTEVDDEMTDQSLFKLKYFFKETRSSRSLLTAEEHLHLTRLTKGLYVDGQLP